MLKFKENGMERKQKREVTMDSTWANLTFNSFDDIYL
jgi:hypothetical protein